MKKEVVEVGYHKVELGKNTGIQVELTSTKRGGFIDILPKAG